jgi:carbamoylphosphate synthase large subunit
MESRPDIVIPGDDFAADLLHRLHGTTRDVGVRTLIEHSLGEPEFYPSKLDRRRMIEIAESVGVSVPRTVQVTSRSDLIRQLEKIGLPAFFKIDGSWGGIGVARIDDATDARRAWRRLSNPLHFVRAVKRVLFNGDITGFDRLLRRQRAVFSLQAAQDGQLAIVSAACYRGELLGMISARVLSQQSAFGPAKMIQIEDQLPVRDAVAKIVRHLGLSGLCGFDFILQANGEACFIELNPRATQTSTFISARDRDPLVALLDVLGGSGRPRSNILSNGEIVTIR